MLETSLLLPRRWWRRNVPRNVVGVWVPSGAVRSSTASFGCTTPRTSKSRLGRRTVRVRHTAARGALTPIARARTFRLPGLSWLRFRPAVPS
jgi:hypothetical protein